MDYNLQVLYHKSRTMDRRNALKNVAVIMGGAIVGGELFLTGCKGKNKEVNSVKELFAAEQIAYMDEIGETILPETSTPGAKEAKVGAFMADMVQDCYTPRDQKIFVEGLKKINDVSQKQFGKSFVDCLAEQRTQLLTALDKEAKEVHRKQKGSHYFTLMKQLTLLGYFTSESGATKALRYLPIPGKYEGNYSYKKGDKAWALS